MIRPDHASRHSSLKSSLKSSPKSSLKSSLQARLQSSLIPRGRLKQCGLLILGALLSLAGWHAVDAQSNRPPKPRVEPRSFDPQETNRVFFPDVFSVLIGSRPAQLAPSQTPTAPSAPAGAIASRPESPPAPGSPATDVSSSGSGWEELISATTIEDEIKAIKQSVDRDVTNPGEFRGRGYRECRQHFSIAAMLFGIITEYDGEVRWKNTATAARDVFARSAANAKVGSVQVYNEARLRKDDLDEILNGGTIAGPRESSTDVTWGSLLDRSPLMMRLETAWDGQIQPLTANASEMASHRDKLIHEAELMAAMAQILVGEGMVDGDDSTYAEYADEMRDGARQIIQGARANDYDRVREGVGTIRQSCSNCHESYRG